MLYQLLRVSCKDRKTEHWGGLFQLLLKCIGV